MFPKPRHPLSPNTYAYESTPLVKPTGFREYDARWWFGIQGSSKAPELNLHGVQALGLGLGTLIHEFGVAPKIVVGHDFRFYSQSIKQALTLGLMQAGLEVHDIGLALSPTAYFAQFALDVPCVDGDGLAQRKRLLYLGLASDTFQISPWLLTPGQARGHTAGGAKCLHSSGPPSR